MVRFWKTLKRHGTATTAVLLVIFAGLWGFVELADEVYEGQTRRFDEKVLLALRAPGDAAEPLGPRWVEDAARDITALGGFSVLCLLTVGVVGYLLLQRKRIAAALVIVAVVGGQALSVSLKHGFNRPRPDLVPHGTEVFSPSFPSGHSMMSAVTYLTLGALLMEIQKTRRTRYYLLGWAVLLALLVGVSRVYLGVHWPTDVLAGWLAGAVWASLCWLVARWVERRARIDLAAAAPPQRLTNER